MKIFKLIPLTLWMLACATQLALGQAPSAQGRIRKHEGAISNQYIVVFKDSVPQGRVTAFASGLARAHGRTVGFTYQYALRGFSVEMSEAQAVAMSRNPQVEYIEEDVLVEGASTQTGAPWGLDRIDQRTLPLDTTYTYLKSGTGVNVYVIDGGIRMTHQEFGGRAAFAYDNVGDGRNGVDCNGHGTHVAGIIGGNTYGVAKGAKLWAVRVLNCSNQALASRILAGIDWVTANHVKPAVANMSFASGVGNDAMDLAVRNSINAGVTYVVAAGNNNGDAGLRSPARVREALTVAATDINDTRAVISNFGAAVDIFAPGVDIVSASSIDDVSTTTRSGTSSAAPFVAGAAAQYLESNPGAFPAYVAAAIKGSATTGVVVNPGPGSPNRLLYSRYITPPRDNRADFDGDNKTDISVFYQSSGDWVSLDSSTGQYVSIKLGQSGDIPTPGDYNGDGKTDRAVFRPGDGTWYISTDTSGAFYSVTFGLGSDIPVARDYDGDGNTDIALFRPSDGYWYILNSSNNSVSYVPWGQYGDRPVPGDFDGDGKANVAVFRPSDRTWYILRTNGTFFGGPFGYGDDLPVQADYDGDGRTDIAVYRPGTNEWFRLNSSNGLFQGGQLGQYGDRPVPGDYDGDGKADVAMYQSNGTWIISNSNTGNFDSVLFFTGLPVPGAYLTPLY